jgi:hypothetical protein
MALYQAICCQAFTACILYRKQVLQLHFQANALALACFTPRCSEVHTTSDMSSGCSPYHAYTSGTHPCRHYASTLGHTHGHTMHKPMRHAHGDTTHEPVGHAHGDTTHEPVSPVDALMGTLRNNQWDTPMTVATHPACELVVPQVQASERVDGVRSADDGRQAAGQQVA